MFRTFYLKYAQNEWHTQLGIGILHLVLVYVGYIQSYLLSLSLYSNLCVYATSDINFGFFLIIHICLYKVIFLILIPFEISINFLNKMLSLLFLGMIMHSWLRFNVGNMRILMLNEICSWKCIDLNFPYAGLVYTCWFMIKCCLIYMLVYVYVYIYIYINPYVDW